MQISKPVLEKTMVTGTSGTVRLTTFNEQHEKQPHYSLRTLPADVRHVGEGMKSDVLGCPWCRRPVSAEFDFVQDPVVGAAARLFKKGFPDASRR